MRIFRIAALTTAVVLLAIFAGAKRTATTNASPPADLSKLFAGLHYRNIGPFRGGRATAAAGVPGEPLVFYFGATGGGVWKTTDGGAHWAPISDKYFRTGSVGAIAVAPSDRNVIYVGMGESPIRGNVSSGDGVYKTTDGGQTWANIGLRDSEQISRVAVDPRSSDHVYVAAQGHVWGPSRERGIYESEDGGKTWKNILAVSDLAGACDLSMDPSNPRILFAAFWEVVRHPWTLDSGGSGSSLWKTSDGGAHWTKLTTDNGLPDETWGRVGVAVSPAREGRVWALIEAKKKGGLYLSDDGGAHFALINSAHSIRQRAWYYSWIFPDPKNADTIYFPNVDFYKSSDAGKTLEKMDVPHGDNHDMWIDPDDPDHMILVNDGGATITFDGGKSWSTQNNQPTAQFYRVITDDRWPYWVYGAQQDNATAATPSGLPEGGRIGYSDWWHDVGGGESGWIAPDPRDPDIVYASAYGGAITRYDRRTRQTREIDPWPQLASGMATRDLKYRSQWNAPVLVSRHNPDELFFASQYLHLSTDQGQTWKIVSPDLTRDDKSKQGYSGGNISHDITGVEVYDTIFALAESPVKAGVIWAGSDDGLVHLTTDNGQTWHDVTPKGMPEWTRINSIEASPFDAGTAYIAATRYQYDDDAPYLYRTADGGKTWTKIVNGIPDGAFTRVVRQDPVRRDLLYCGTERGIYISFDDGGRWEPFQLNLPYVPVTDLAVKSGDLVVATQGRAFWILDDLSPLRDWSGSIANAGVHFFPPRPSVRTQADPEGKPPAAPTAGENMPAGVVINYWLKNKPAKTDKITIDILDNGKVIRSFTNQKKKKEALNGEENGGEESAANSPGEAGHNGGEKPLKVEQGMNRFVWDMRVFKPTLVHGAVINEGTHAAPKVAPGTYAAKLTVNGVSSTQPFVVKANPNLKVSDADLKAQYDLLEKIENGLSGTMATVIKIRDLKTQISSISDHADRLGKGEAVKPKAQALIKKLTEISGQLLNPAIKSDEDDLNYVPKLDESWAALAGEVTSADAKPTRAEEEYYGVLRARLDAVLGEFDAAVKTDLADFNHTVQQEQIPPVMTLEKVEEQH